MKCRNTQCNNSYDDNFEYCPYCGVKSIPPKFCEQCIKIITEREFRYCPKCGAKLRFLKESDKILLRK